MTPRNLSESVAYERGEAERLLGIARALIDVGGLPDAANRAYYSVFHFTVAMLLVVGHEVRAHAGAKALLGSELVVPGHIPRRAAEIFGQLEGLRAAADYRRFFDVPREQAEAAVASAEEFSAFARAFLSAQGF